MPNKQAINNPHDKYFRAMMGYKEFSSEFFQTYLPKRISDNVDFDSLQLLNETHLDKHLQKVINDLLFSCKINGQEAYLSILVEHQSSADKFIAFRIYHYLFSFLNSRLKQHPGKPLPPVYAMLFYHGEQTPYPYSLNLLDCFDDPLDIMQNVLFQPVPIVDVNQIPDGELEKQAWVGTLSMAMKYIRQPEISPYVVKILKQLPQVKTPTAREMLVQLLVYLLNTGEIDNINKFIEIGAELPPPVRSEVMTIAEMLEARGEARGEANALATVAKKMLIEGTDIEVIMKITGLTAKEVQALK